MNTSISCLRHHSLSRALRHGAEICQCLHFHFVPCMLVQPSSVFFNVASRFSCCGHYHISNLGRQFPPSHHPTSILNVCCTFHASSVLLLVPLKNSKKKIVRAFYTAYMCVVINDFFFIMFIFHHLYFWCFSSHKNCLS